MTTVAAASRPSHASAWLLKACIFATGLAGIVAEYVMATLASYLLGNAVVQWAMTISTMLFAMGVGSFLSRHIHRRLLDAFIAAEIALSLLCGVSAVLVYGLAAFVPADGVLIYSLTLLIGLLIGMEIPLLTRVNEQHAELRVNISSVMQYDYFGALLGGVLFSFVALPRLGLTYTPLLLATANLGVAGLLLYRAQPAIRFPRPLAVAVAVVVVLFGTLAMTADEIILHGEQARYRDKVIYTRQTPYQKIVMTRWGEHVWLYLDGHTQFSTYDEYRYHEPLVHPAMLTAHANDDVLVLGGGDGMAVREILKHDPESVTLVDLDPAVTELARTHPILLEHNGNSLHDDRVSVVNADASAWLAEDDTLYDVIVIDLPDPRSVDLARLYSLEFYRMVERHLAVGGVMVTQASSPLYAPEAFMSVLKTVREAGLTALPMHANIASMGEWGWVIARKDSNGSIEALRHAIVTSDPSVVPTRFLRSETMPGLLSFGTDTLAAYDRVEPNRMSTLRIQDYYRSRDWEMY